MNKILLPLIFIACVAFCSAQESKFSFYDSNNIEITKQAYQNYLNSNEFLEIPGNQPTEKRLIERKNHGKISKVDEVYSMIAKTTGNSFEQTAPIVVIYYPGKDENNSTGATSKISLKQRHKKLSKGLQEIAGINPVYFYKEDEGLNKYKKVVNWYKDPDCFFEKNFFKYHYPGYSFVVISPTGEFASYFGEFPNKFVIEATKQLL